MTSTEAFETVLNETAKTVTATLKDVFGSHRLIVGTPHRLLDAMRHGVLNGGKRLRPFLVLETAKLFSAPQQAAMDVAIALECIHCYSLIHDDLPAMDDDSVRRGKPTVHKAFDEATAVLAGDGLLTLAFGLIAEAESIPPAPRIALISALSRRAGVAGMVGGQMLDMNAQDHDLKDIEITRMQTMKTGALLSFACEAGAIVGGATVDHRNRLRHLGEVLGRAYQLSDDLLDETGDAGAMGKAARKDRGQGKKTMVALHGVDWAKDRLYDLSVEAEELLKHYGDQATTLRAATRYIVSRSH
ncbi:polyprenyl synthetase family protein [Consotaella salsifontis]|uniref:Probable farnesyl diphosphate synthase n=1 Tax=Consotaella salsifontis TaxID=1365950 RepID=A0A1T4SQF9_9HYPH|nr:farnesyl diphosphate synthase [Consotaella salsifontis]SKA30403.1 farnesyl-diphosphate synthase [Consotaella salsifontis]